MLVPKIILNFYYARAEEEKSQIRGIYNDVLKLTDPFTTISDSGKQRLGSRRQIDSAIVDAIDAITSFIMDSIMSRTGKWCEFILDKKKINEENLDNQSSNLDDVEKFLQEDTDKVFSYIQSSNYFKEISRAVKSFVRVGTGAYAIRATGSNAIPFIYQYIGLDNLFILEDNLSRPNIVFKKHPELNASKIKDLFGADAKLPSGLSEDEPKTTVDVMEVVIPNYDEETAKTTFYYMVMDDKFDFTIKEMEMEYNPFVVFRWDVIEGNSWGTSAVINNYDIIEDLETYKEIFKKQAKRKANPAGIFYGNEALFYSLDFEEGKMNYGGDPKLEGEQMANYQVLDDAGNLMPLDKVIAECRSSFRQALMVDDLVAGTMSQGKDVTATFVAYKQELFRKRFSATYELINSELLEPTFKAPFTIMLEQELLNTTDEILKVTQIRYINALSKASDMAEVNKIMDYAGILGRLEQAKQIGITLNYPKTTAEIANLIGMKKELIPTEEELEQIQQMKLQQLQQGMGGMIPNETAVSASTTEG